MIKSTEFDLNLFVDGYPDHGMSILARVNYKVLDPGEYEIVNINWYADRDDPTCKTTADFLGSHPIIGRAILLHIHNEEIHRDEALLAARNTSTL